MIETEPDIQDAEDAKPLTNVCGDVSYENVSFHYQDDETPVLSLSAFGFRQADRSHWSDRPEVVRPRSVRCFHVFTM